MLNEIISFFNSPFFTSLLTGLSIGIGTTFGAWLINHGVIKRIEFLEKKIGDFVRH
jgi:hypothetical protein